MYGMSGINDFVVRFANVNGTGSASANSIFAKTIFRMGVPVSPKNIFPSNIQGLPTWYEVRVSEQGYLGRKDGIDLMVSVNPQSLVKDIASVKSGGYFMFDSTKPLHEDHLRADIHYVGIPLMEICNNEFTDARQRQLFKNIVYVGALAQLLQLDFNVIEGLFADQFKGKEKLIAPNMKALNLGANYVVKNYTFPLPFFVERRTLTGDSILVDGNTACGLGAVYAGASVVSWYPITPSTSLVDAFADYAHELRVDEVTGQNKFAIVQAEDELAAIGMVIGANWNGARSFTATSGPGLSLMNEFLGLAYFAEIPAVLVDVQRAGPSTGMPTRTQQSDILEAAYASHGDTKQIVLFPSTPKECFDFMSVAFDMAEQIQTPVIVLSDLDLGMNDHMCAPFEWNDELKYNRGKVLSADQLENIKDWGRYLDIDGDGIPYRTLPGVHPSKGSYFTRGTSHDEYSKYAEDSAAYMRNVERLVLKFKTAANMLPQPIIKGSKSLCGIVYVGTSNFAVEEAADLLALEGVKCDTMRIRAFPFSAKVEDFINDYEYVIVVEQNRDAQLRSLLMIECGISPNRLRSVLNYDGAPITANLIITQIKNIQMSTLSA
jgi:2-oxoglutarate/2-oxoacid ferredoxin oxidoreductase subunit alpha